MNLNFEEHIVIENDRCRLEPLTIIDHFEALMPISDKYPDLLQYSPSKFGSRENLTHYFNNAKELKLAKSWYSFAVFDKKNDVYAGSTSYLCVSNYDKRLEIGATWIDKDYHGSGLNSHMKYLMLRYAFESLGAERVEFRIDARNIRSRKAVEKLGALFEGELKSHTLLLDGHRRDTVFYGILKRNWAECKKILHKTLGIE